MANPDIPAALVVLQAHLVAAGAALTDPILDVDRGIVVGGRQIRYYWSGEVDAPRFDSRYDLTGELVGQRFTVAATFPLSGLATDQVAALDAEMQTLATEIRTRLDGDNDLGGHIDNHVLGFVDPVVMMFGTVRTVVLEWDVEMAYVEYALG